MVDNIDQYKTGAQTAIHLRPGQNILSKIVLWLTPFSSRSAFRRATGHWQTCDIGLGDPQRLPES